MTGPGDVGIPEKGEQNGVATLSQWRLMGIRFARHKLALAGLFVLAVFYLVAIFAEFIAPYNMDRRDLDYIYCPPQLPKFSFSRGFHLEAMMRQVDPVTLKSYYVRQPGTIHELGFLVKVEPYRMWGFIPLNRRLFGLKAGDAEMEPSFYFLGSDKYGRCIFSRLVHGSRISLSIGLIAIFITFTLGVSMGGVSGYLGGAVDVLIQRLIEIINSFPQLPMWLALAALLPGDWPALRIYFAITIVLSLLNWAGLARVVRGKILALREEDYTMAAQLLGASHVRVLFRHLVPGFTSHILVVLTLSIPTMILGETALSFLGLGLRPPIVSWGVMLQDCISLQVVSNYPWLLMPLFTIVLTVLSFNFLGDGLRDAADPYSYR